MDFLNKAYKQISDLFLSMTPGARITAGLLLAVIVVSIVYLFQVQTVGTSDYLMGGREFTQDELTDMARAFGKADLGEYEIDELRRVRVPRGQRAAYMAALADENALPKNFTSYLDKVLTESKGPFATSNSVLKQQLKNDKEKKLSMMISKMKGIEHANVHFEVTTRPGLRADVESRAVVFVKPEGKDALSPDRIGAIQTTVETSVIGLSPENVTVTDLNAARAYRGDKNGGIPGVPNSPYLANKLAYEDLYRKDIQNLLKDVPDVVVGVQVELDTSLVNQETALTYDPKPVAVSVKESTTSESSKKAEKGGRPGVASNPGSSNAPAQISQSPGTESTVEETDSESQSVVSQIRKENIKAPLVPTRVTATIGVPKEYYLQLWHANNKPEEGEEPKEPNPTELAAIEQDKQQMFKRMITQLLPKRDAGKDPFDHVTVETIERLEPEPFVGPTTSETAMAWLGQNWQSIGMAMFGVFSLVMLRGMVRSGANSETSGEDVTPQLQTDGSTTPSGDDEDHEEDEQAARLRFDASGPDLRSELTQLVKEDPDAAASVLKAWIGDAA